MLALRRVISWNAGAILLALFIAHLFFPAQEHRLRFAFLYLGLALGIMAMDWLRLRMLFGEGPPDPD